MEGPRRFAFSYIEYRWYIYFSKVHRQKSLTKKLHSNDKNQTKATCKKCKLRFSLAKEVLNIAKDVCLCY